MNYFKLETETKPKPWTAKRKGFRAAWDHPNG